MGPKQSNGALPIGSTRRTRSTTQSGASRAILLLGRSVEEATEYEIQNVMKSVRHPYFREALHRFMAGEQKSDVEQVRLR